jgi:hypothetical protein
MPPGMRFFAWGGTKRPDTTAPVFNVMVGTPPPGERIGTPDQALADWIEASRRNHLSNWRETPFSNVEINGLTFTYKRWSGINAKSGLQIHGIAFLAMDGKNVIIIASQDVVWHHEEALKISESAAASFRRK